MKYFLGSICLLFICVNNSCKGQNDKGKEEILIQTAEACASANGYWYKGKCWVNYEDEEGISLVDIDRIVDEDMKSVGKTKLNINDQLIPMDLIFLEDGIITFLYQDKEYTLLLEDNDEWEKEGVEHFNVKTEFMLGNVFDKIEDDEKLIAKGTLTVYNRANGNYEVMGTLNIDKKEALNINLFFNEKAWDAGTTVLEIKETEAYLSGVLGFKGYYQFKKMIAEHPEVKTVVFTYVPGSINDAVNMHTGRLIKEAGLTTKVLFDSEIYSGGVDLFCSGKERIVEKGAKIGIHSWCCVDDLTAAELPKDHPAHRYQIAYFEMCLGKEKGEDFYFLTLNSAPAGGMYEMRDDEIKKWNVATTFIE